MESLNPVGLRAGGCRQSGFTLLELMLATVITAVALGGLFAAYSRALDTADGVRHGARLAQNARLVLGRLDADLAGALAAGAGGDSSANLRFTAGLGQEEPEPEGSRDPRLEARHESGKVLLDFYTAAGTEFGGAFPSGRICRVQYVLRPSKESAAQPASSPRAGAGGPAAQPGLLVRRERPHVLSWADEPWRELELADNVEGFALLFRSLGAQGQGQPQAGWDSAAAGPAGEPMGLPALVSMELTLAREGLRRTLARQTSLASALQRPAQ